MPKIIHENFMYTYEDLHTLHKVAALAANTELSPSLVLVVLTRYCIRKELVNE